MIENLLCQALAKLACGPSIAIIAWAVQQMQFLVEQDGDSWLIKNPAAANYQAVISEDLEPVVKAISLALLVAGSDWPAIFPGLTEAVCREQKLQMCQIPSPRTRAAPSPGKSKQGPTFFL